MSKKGTTRNKDSAKSRITRFAVSFDPPGSSTRPSERQAVMVRQVSHRSQAGSHHQPERRAIIEDPWLPADDHEIGLDQDSTSCDNALNTEFDALEREKELHQAEKKAKKKKKKKSLASVRYTSLCTFCDTC